MGVREHIVLRLKSFSERVGALHGKSPIWSHSSSKNVKVMWE
jgi:hypothetical protein